MELHRICVFCGSSMGFDPVYREHAILLGRYMANNNLSLVFGGGKVGIMGTLADAVLQAGGNCIGVMPQHIAALEIAHKGITEMHIVNSMPERKSLMVKISDAFIAFPGGLGTLDELSEVLTLSQLRIADKPVGLLNINRFFDPLIHFIHHGVKEGFIREEHAANLAVADKPDELIAAIKQYKPVGVGKWIEEIKQEMNTLR